MQVKKNEQNAFKSTFIADINFFLAISAGFKT
jgi:hypothetical protein